MGIQRKPCGDTYRGYLTILLGAGGFHRRDVNF
jgi:hypothetical protein